MSDEIFDMIPRSRVTIKYKTEVNGVKKDKEIPFKLLITGDLSSGSSKDSKLELDKREIRSLDGKNLNATMKDMGMILDIEVENCINPDKKPMLSVKIPIDSTKAFNPSSIVDMVPELKSLVLLKELIKEMETTIDNSKFLKQGLSEIFSNDEKFQKFKDSIPFFKDFTLPAPNLKAANENLSHASDSSTAKSSSANPETTSN